MEDAGDLLRRWRVDVAGLPVLAAAARAGRSRTYLTNMETGRKPVPRKVWDDLDEAYQARSVLAQLLAALPTSTSTPARRLWSHNYDHRSSAVWIWLRAAEAETAARITWGPLKLSVEAVPYPDGVFVSSPTSLPNPPAEAHFEALGWADFGTGVIPAELGVPVIDGASSMAAAPWDRRASRESRRRFPLLLRDVLVLARNFGLGTRDVIPNLATVLPRQEPALDVTDEDADTSTVRLVSPEELKEIRVSKGWHASDLASAITKRQREFDRTARLVTSDDIDSAELGRASRYPHLLARIDLELGLGGTSCLSPIADVVRLSATRWRVTFPSFWVGPIWLRIDAGGVQAGVAASERVTLTWLPWRRRLNVVTGAVVTTRRASTTAAPLLVDMPAGWALQAGLGRPTGAHDVGEGWRPANLKAMRRLLRDALSAVREQVDPHGTKPSAVPPRSEP